MLLIKSQTYGCLQFLTASKPRLRFQLSFRLGIDLNQSRTVFASNMFKILTQCSKRRQLGSDSIDSKMKRDTSERHAIDCTRIYRYVSRISTSPCTAHLLQRRVHIQLLTIPPPPLHRIRSHLHAWSHAPGIGSGAMSREYLVAHIDQHCSLVTTSHYNSFPWLSSDIDIP